MEVRDATDKGVWAIVGAVEVGDAGPSGVGRPRITGEEIALDGTIDLGVRGATVGHDGGRGGD